MKQTSRLLACLPLLLSAIPALARQPLNRTPMKAPESVIIHKNGYYISDTGGDPSKKDGDGIIYHMDAKGQLTVFADSIDSPKGSWILHNTLYVTDVDKVRGYDLSSKKEVFTLDMSAAGTSLLNDIAAMNDSTLFVSASDISKVFIVHTGKTPRYEELVTNNVINGANGLIYDTKRKRLYACGFGTAGTPNGEIGYIDMTRHTRQFIPLTPRTGYYDGIVLTANNTRLLISDWVAFEKKGVVIELDLKTGKITTINKTPIAGAADFTLNKKGDIIMPAMMEGNVLLIRR